MLLTLLKDEWHRGCTPQVNQHRAVQPATCKQWLYLTVPNCPLGSWGTNPVLWDAAASRLDALVIPLYLSPVWARCRNRVQKVYLKVANAHIGLAALYWSFMVLEEPSDLLSVILGGLLTISTVTPCASACRGLGEYGVKHYRQVLR